MITRDMLAAKYASRKMLDEFDLFFPNGFDWKVVEPDLDMSVEELLDDLAEMFDYTGVYVYEDLYNVCHINYVSGIRQNFSNGNPAWALFHKGSKLPSEIAFYKDGKLHNPAPFLPAIIAYSNSYSKKNIYVKIIEFYENDQPVDISDDIPQRIVFSSNGKIVSRHFCNVIP